MLSGPPAWRPLSAFPRGNRAGSVSWAASAVESGRGGASLGRGGPGEEARAGRGKLGSVAARFEAGYGVQL